MLKQAFKIFIAALNYQTILIDFKTTVEEKIDFLSDTALISRLYSNLTFLR